MPRESSPNAQTALALNAEVITCIESPPDHPGSTCPRVKRLVFLGNGNRVEVEYFPNGEWEENVIFTEDVYDDSEEPDDA